MQVSGDKVRDALRWLERRGSKRIRDELEPRYGIRVTKAFGVPVGRIRQLGKQLGQDHALAQALWETGWYEARLLAAFVAEPARVTPAQMDRWARGFDNWGVVDTVCFHLLDRSPHAWRKVEQWTAREDEFIRRAGFVLLACLALHDADAPDERFQRGLALIERGAGDPRNFVKKGVLWGLRGIGDRNPALNAAAKETALRLSQSDHPSGRWIGKTALRELNSAATRRRLARRKAKPVVRSRATKKKTKPLSR